MKQYEGNMKKYKRITLPKYKPWDLKKFQARPARRGGGVGERKDMKHVNRTRKERLELELGKIRGRGRGGGCKIDKYPTLDPEEP